MSSTRCALADAIYALDISHLDDGSDPDWPRVGAMSIERPELYT